MESFDYVVIGAGSAGCVLASRLPAADDVSAVLLEAGGRDNAPDIRIPAAVHSMFGSDHEWAYTSVPQAFTGQPLRILRGRTLGSSSSLNAMMYSRGNHADYDRWRDDYGAHGWGFDDVLPCFIWSEGNARHTGPLHGTDGPLRVEDPRWMHDLCEVWVECAIAAGMPANDDFSGPTQSGAGSYQVTQRDGQRWSVADAYLHPVVGRFNVTVRTRSAVRRILIDDQGATGVVYRDASGDDRVVRAGHEKLPCPGAIASPQLLMVSDIGPGDDLREVGVPMVVDAVNVGAGLQDHPTTAIIWTTSGITHFRDAASTEEAATTWSRERREPLTSIVSEAGMFSSTLAASGPPNIQVSAGGTSYWDDGTGHSDVPCTGGVATLVDPASRGSVRLRSADPAEHPLMGPQFYAEPGDLDAMLAAMEVMFDVATQKPLARSISGPCIPHIDRPDRKTLVSRVRRHTQKMYHPTGTCAMGDAADSVLDPDLRVRGIGRLLVIDASVMPATIRGNTKAPVVMIAERAAEMILTGAGLDTCPSR
jgi:choline dehydrogenase